MTAKREWARITVFRLQEAARVEGKPEYYAVLDYPQASSVNGTVDEAENNEFRVKGMSDALDELRRRAINQARRVGINHVLNLDPPIRDQ